MVDFRLNPARTRRVFAVKSLTFGLRLRRGRDAGLDGHDYGVGKLRSVAEWIRGGEGFDPGSDGRPADRGGRGREPQVVWEHTNVWDGGQLIATYDPNGLRFFLDDCDAAAIELSHETALRPKPYRPQRVTRSFFASEPCNRAFARVKHRRTGEGEPRTDDQDSKV